MKSALYNGSSWLLPTFFRPQNPHSSIPPGANLRWFGSTRPLKNSDVDIRNPESFRFPPIWYILPIWGLYITYHLTREAGNSIDAVFFSGGADGISTFSGRGQCTEHRHFSPLGVLNEKIQGPGVFEEFENVPKTPWICYPSLDVLLEV